MRIRHQLALAFFAVGILGLAALTSLRVSATRDILIARMETRGHALAEAAEGLVVPYLRRGDTRALAEKLTILVRLPGVVSIQVFDPEGKRLAVGRRKTAADPDADGSDRISAATEIIDAGSGSVLGRVEVTMSKSFLRHELQAQRWRDIALESVAVIGLAAFSWLIGTLMGRRLEALAHAVKRIEDGKPLKLKDEGGDSEVDHLSRAITALHDRLSVETAQRKKLEAFKEDLTNMLVHDMKHPITVLSALIAILDDKEQEMISEEKRECLLEMAKKNLKREDRMIEDLLHVAKLGSPEMPLQKQRLSLAALLEECASENSVIVEQARRVWALEIDSAIPACWIHGDAVLLKRVIGNLVLNAIEHSPPEGSITLGARLSAKDRSMAEIFVRDQGPGVPAHQRQAIFQKFRSFSESAKNVGLGLAFCKLAAEKHEAGLELVDDAAPGTTFALIIPVSFEPLPGDEPGAHGLVEPPLRARG